jgi:hypothetical protein
MEGREADSQIINSRPETQGPQRSIVDQMGGPDRPGNPKRPLPKPKKSDAPRAPKAGAGRTTPGTTPRKRRPTGSTGTNPTPSAAKPINVTFKGTGGRGNKAPDFDKRPTAGKRKLRRGGNTYREH